MVDSKPDEMRTKNQGKNSSESKDQKAEIMPGLKSVINNASSSYSQAKISQGSVGSREMGESDEPKKNVSKKEISCEVQKQFEQYQN